MTTRIITDSNGRKHITNEPLLHPPQRTWVGLTNEEIDDAARYCVKSGQSVNAAIRDIEAKLKEKNG
jgi:hypothetical protein